MLIAVPLAQGRLSMHFGHCEEFAFIEASPDTGEIVRKEIVPSPEHQPGLLPKWISEKGAEVVITGGMGPRAQSLFEQAGVRVITGASSEPPEKIVRDFLSGSLSLSDNVCDH